MTKIVVYGDGIDDVFTELAGVKINPESGCPVFVKGHRQRSYPGGAANTARMLERITGVEVVNLATPARTRKERLMFRGEQRARVDSLTSASFCVDACVQTLKEVANPDAIAISDYREGACNAKQLNAIFAHAKQHGVPLVIDPKRFFDVDYRSVYIKCNQHEAKLLGGGAYFTEYLGCLGTVITCEECGPVIYDRSGVRYCETLRFPPMPFQASGAGDTFTAFLTLGLGRSLSLDRAAAYAYRAAAAAGLFAPMREPVLQREIEAIDRPGRLKLLETEQELTEWCEHRAGDEVVVTTGCFDLFHAGHAEYLEEIARQGRKLLVLVNADADVKAKGAGRPIHPLSQRMRVLAAQSSVDAVSFCDRDPSRMLAICTKAMGSIFAVRATGPDYSARDVLGPEYAARYYQAKDHGSRTSKIIEQVRDSG